MTAATDTTHQKGRTITACRACDSPDLIDVLDLGQQYLSEFREDDSKPARHPLALVFCVGCTLLQLRHTAPPAALFHRTYSYQSGISAGIRRDLADVARYALAANQDARSWLDIASNDGTLLSNVSPDIYRAGIDPLPQFAAAAERYADRIVPDFFDPAHFDGQQFDIVTAVSMFYDLDDPRRFVQGLAEVLAPRGVAVIQQNYVLSMLDNNSVDNISHEHLAYYSLTSLRRLLATAGLEVNDIDFSDINGGCFRVIVSHVGARPVQTAVALEEAAERHRGISLPATYLDFAECVGDLLAELRDLVRGINIDGGKVYVLGASTRGAVIWQAAGLDVDDLPKVVDINPDKIGRVMSAIGAPIIGEAQARAEKPSHMILGPWWLQGDVVERERDYLAAGGRIIVPIPRIRIVEG